MSEREDSSAKDMARRTFLAHSAAGAAFIAGLKASKRSRRRCQRHRSSLTLARHDAAHRRSPRLCLDRLREASPSPGRKA